MRHVRILRRYRSAGRHLRQHLERLPMLEPGHGPLVRQIVDGAGGQHEAGHDRHHQHRLRPRSRPTKGETVIACDGGREQEGQDEALILRAMVEQYRILTQEIFYQRRREPDEHVGREQRQKGQRSQKRPQVDQAPFREQTHEDAPGMEHEGPDDLGHRAAEVRVAPEVRIGLTPEVRDEPPRVHHEDREPSQRGDRTPEPAPLGHGQPEPEAHHGDGRILARGEDEEHGRHVPPRPPCLDEVDGGEKERDGEGGRVEVAHVDPVERGMDQVEHGEHCCRLFIAQPPRGDAEDGEGAQAQRDRLGDKENARAGSDPEDGNEQVHDRREVVTPRVHLGQADPWPGASGEVPRELDIVGEVEGVGPERPVPGERDQGKVDGIDGHADGHHAARAEPRHGQGGHHEPQGDDAQEDEEDLFRTPPPVDERGEHGQAAEEGREVQQANEAQRAAEVPESGPSRLYRPRSVCSRRERLSPLECSACRVTTQRILSP